MMQEEHGTIVVEIPEPSAVDIKIKEAVATIARKARAGSVDEIAHVAITNIVGTTAVHDYEEWKTPERLDWAMNLLADALKS